MGWNTGYSIYEEQVVNAYDTGQLTPELLKIIINPFLDTDIDHGGDRGLRTNDGLSADEVVVKLLRPSFYEEHFYKRNDIESDYHERLWDGWYSIVVKGEVE